MKILVRLTKHFVPKEQKHAKEAATVHNQNNHSLAGRHSSVESSAPHPPAWVLIPSTTSKLFSLYSSKHVCHLNWSMKRTKINKRPVLALFKKPLWSETSCNKSISCPWKTQNHFLIRNTFRAIYQLRSGIILGAVTVVSVLAFYSDVPSLNTAELSLATYINTVLLYVHTVQYMTYIHAVQLILKEPN